MSSNSTNKEQGVFNARKSPGFYLYLGHKRYDGYLNRLLKEYNFNTSHWPMLNQIYLNEGVTQKELADLCERNPSSIGKSVDIMEKNNWIERRTNPEDRRIYNLFLTEKGREVHKTIGQYAEKVRQKGTQGFTEDELNQLYSYIMRIMNNLE